MTPNEFDTLCKKVDSGFEMLRVAITAMSGKPVGSWTPTVQLTDRDNLPKMPDGVMVYSKPVDGVKYFIGADVAGGIGADISAFSVIGKFPKGKLRQVAWFRSNTIDPLALANVLDAVGRIYNDAEIAPEVNRFDSCLVGLRFRCGYPNVYQWKVLTSDKQSTHRFGWFTTASTRPRMIHFFWRLIKGKLLKVNDPACLKEMKNHAKTGISPGGDNLPDDNLMALMITAYIASESEYFA